MACCPSTVNIDKVCFSHLIDREHLDLHLRIPQGIRLDRRMYMIASISVRRDSGFSVESSRIFPLGFVFFCRDSCLSVSSNFSLNEIVRDYWVLVWNSDCQLSGGSTISPTRVSTPKGTQPIILAIFLQKTAWNVTKFDEGSAPASLEPPRICY